MWKLPIGLGQSGCTGLLRIAQMPEHATIDNGGQIHLLGETVTVLLIGEDIDGQWHATSGQHAHQALVTQRTYQAIERHGGDMIEDRAQFQTEAAVCRPQGIAGHVRSHLTITQDEVRQHGEHRAACGALKTPDGDATQTDPRVMGVTREAPAAATGGLVEELKPQGQEKGEDAFDERLPVTKKVKVGRFVLKIDSDGAVCACRCSCFLGFDHGVGHPLLLLYDAKAPLGKNSNYFNGLGHDLSNPFISLF